MKLCAIFSKSSQNEQLQRHGTDKGTKVRDHLRHLDSQLIEEERQDQYTGDEEDALPGDCQEGGGNGFAGDLLGHIAHNDPALEGETAALQPQGQRAVADHIRIIPEQSDNLGRENGNQSSHTAQKSERTLYAEPKAFLYPLVKLGTIIETAEGLETLAETDHCGGTELHDPLHNTHSSDQRVTVRLSRVIEADGGKGRDALAGQGRQTALENIQHVVAVDTDTADRDMNVITTAAANQQDDKADKLADDGSPACAGHA